MCKSTIVKVKFWNLPCKYLRNWLEPSAKLNQFSPVLTTIRGSRPSPDSSFFLRHVLLLCCACWYFLELDSWCEVLTLQCLSWLIYFLIPKNLKAQNLTKHGNASSKALLFIMNYGMICVMRECESEFTCVNSCNFPCNIFSW